MLGVGTKIAALQSLCTLCPPPAVWWGWDLEEKQLFPCWYFCHKQGGTCNPWSHPKASSWMYNPDFCMYLHGGGRRARNIRIPWRACENMDFWVKWCSDNCLTTLGKKKMCFALANFYGVNTLKIAHFKLLWSWEEGHNLLWNLYQPAPAPLSLTWQI